jgi:hypothetical protein
MLFEKDVEVIQVTRAIESVSGDYIYQVTFGQVVDVDDELRRTVPIPANSKAPKKIAPTTLSVFIDASKPMPYKVGSKWKISITENGSMRVGAI